MRFKNIVVGAVLSVGAVIGSTAFAADADHTVQLFANIPSASFHVVPSDADWVGVAQPLLWRPATETLTTFSKNFDLKNTGGAINANLNVAAVLFDGANSIPLEVKMNGVTLSTVSTQIVAAPAALPGLRAPLEIAAIKPGTGYVAGDYTATVNIMFDAM